MPITVRDESTPFIPRVKLRPMRKTSPWSKRSVIIANYKQLLVA